MKIRQFILNIFNHPQKSYIDAHETVKNAARSGKTVCEYVEEIWGIQGNTDLIIHEIIQSGVLVWCERGM